VSWVRAPDGPPKSLGIKRFLGFSLSREFMEY
jgi:hypothetical protein